VRRENRSSRQRRAERHAAFNLLLTERRQRMRKGQRKGGEANRSRINLLTRRTAWSAGLIFHLQIHGNMQ